MNLSVKNMIFAFVAGLVVFSVLMAVICVGIFNSEISVAQSGEAGKPETAEMLTADNAVIFKIESGDTGEISFIVLATVDNEAKRVLLTPIYGDYLIPYKNALSYVSSVYREMGDEMLSEAVKAFSGICVGEENIHAVENIVNYDGFKSAVTAELADKLSDGDISDYMLEDFNVVLTENKTENTGERIKQIDTDKTVEKFKNILG